MTVPRPGNAPLVLKAQIEGYDVERVFMDAGSGINLIYAKTLQAMRISLEFLKPTDCSFHGIVPGSANYPLGRIALDVCFSNRQNYRKKKLDFEVMDWPSQYHAILGQPAFLRFMAVPHYIYLVLKMSGPRGIITVQGIPQDGTNLWHDGRVWTTQWQNRRRNRNYYKMPRGKPRRARNEETSSTSSGPKRSYSKGVRDSPNIDNKSLTSN
jgi:hypothetical protein